MPLCPTCQTNRGPWDESCTKCGFSYKELDAQKKAAGAKASDIAAGCPSCKAPRRAEDASCPGCGVVYAKWKPREERLTVAAPGAASSSAPLLDANAHKERPGCLTLMMVATVVVNAGLALLLSVITPPARMNVQPLGPAIFMSVLTALCDVWVLRWKRWAVYGIVFIQVLSIGRQLLLAPSILMAQPIIVLALFYYFVSPIWYQFD